MEEQHFEVQSLPEKDRVSEKDCLNLRLESKKLVYGNL